MSQLKRPLTPIGPFKYQWVRDGVYIPGENKFGYVVKPEDVGHTLTRVADYMTTREDWHE